jgi:S1-C subfamily serine protease
MPNFHGVTGNASARSLQIRFGAVLFLMVTPLFQCALAQTYKKPAAPAAAQKKVSPAATESKPSEPPGVLVQLNGALETLAAKVSPAVVQILVTGYGPLREEDRSQTAFIVRQHAVGSGVIVDANGYIMTNAHVWKERSAFASPYRSLRAILVARPRSGSAGFLKLASLGSTRKLISHC